MKKCYLLTSETKLNIAVTPINAQHFQITFQVSYLRCTIDSTSYKHSLLTQTVFLLLPVILMVLMYIFMLIVIIKKKRKVGWFLCTTSGIILSSLASYSPSIIANIWNVPISYEAVQILTITLWYTTGIVNPIIYFMAHPKTRQQMRNMTVVVKAKKKLGRPKSGIFRARVTDITAMETCPTDENEMCIFVALRSFDSRDRLQ